MSLDTLKIEQEISLMEHGSSLRKRDGLKALSGISIYLSITTTGTPQRNT